MSQPANGTLMLPWGAGPCSIERHGTTLATCDSEPVQTPGCIQAHGALLVLRLGDLHILQASENTLQHLGEDDGALLDQPVARVVGAAHEARLRDMLAQDALDRGAVYAFTLSSRAGMAALDACLHTSRGVAELEFEGTGRAEARADDDFFMLVKGAVGRLQALVSVRGFCQQVTQEVRAITGLDRVMAYRFHADHCGEVIAESKRDALNPWLGLHCPAADIPQPAREIFKRIWIRPLPDAAGPLVELVPLANPDTVEDVHQQLVVRSAREGDLLALTEHEPSLLDAIDVGGRRFIT